MARKQQSTYLGDLPVELMDTHVVTPATVHVASGLDQHGVHYEARLTVGDKTLYVFRTGLPTRRVTLPDLITAILKARG